MHEKLLMKCLLSAIMVAVIWVNDTVYRISESFHKVGFSLRNMHEFEGKRGMHSATLEM